MTCATSFRRRNCCPIGWRRRRIRSARSVGPKLIATLDRAISYCQSTLTYGRRRRTRSGGLGPRLARAWSTKPSRSSLRPAADEFRSSITRRPGLPSLSTPSRDAARAFESLPKFDRGAGVGPAPRTAKPRWCASAPNAVRLMSSSKSPITDRAFRRARARQCSKPSGARHDRGARDLVWRSRRKSSTRMAAPSFFCPTKLDMEPRSASRCRRVASEG